MATTHKKRSAADISGTVPGGGGGDKSRPPLNPDKVKFRMGTIEAFKAGGRIQLDSVNIVFRMPNAPAIPGAGQLGVI